MSIILASNSQIRAKLLDNAKVPFTQQPAALDEAPLKAVFQRQGLDPKSQALALAEAKAKEISAQNPGHWVIGSDQILALGEEVFSKPRDTSEAISQLTRLSGVSHSLFTAASISRQEQQVFTAQGEVILEMRVLSQRFIEDYVDRNWDSIRHSVGGYKLEEEGVRLFTAIKGDYFHVLGMPLIEILNFFTQEGVLAT